MFHNWEEIRALTDKGHAVSMPLDTSFMVFHKYDLILGPACWRMNETLREYLDLAIKEAQKRSYPKEVTPSE